MHDPSSTPTSPTTPTPVAPSVYMVYYLDDPHHVAAVHSLARLLRRLGCHVSIDFQDERLIMEHNKNAYVEQQLKRASSEGTAHAQKTPPTSNFNWGSNTSRVASEFLTQVSTPNGEHKQMVQSVQSLASKFDAASSV